jgi:hypothetical protein
VDVTVELTKEVGEEDLVSVRGAVGVSCVNDDDWVVDCDVLMVSVADGVGDGVHDLDRSRVGVVDSEGVRVLVRVEVRLRVWREMLSVSVMVKEGETVEVEVNVKLAVLVSGSSVLVSVSDSD